MTKKELEQLRALYLEINTLAGDIFSLQPKIVVDSVTGCTPERTQKHVIPIKGVDMEEYIRLEKKATEKTKILVERINAMEEWLDHISDSEMRIILRMRYRQGKSWEEIGFVLGTIVELLRENAKLFYQMMPQKKPPEWVARKAYHHREVNQDIYSL